MPISSSRRTLSRRALGAAALGLTLSRAAGAKPVRSTGTLAAGTRFETTYTLLDSGLVGPLVMIVAGIHGNELAPPEAARRLLETTGVATVPGSDFYHGSDGDHLLRFCFAKEDDVLREAGQRMAKIAP